MLIVRPVTRQPSRFSSQAATDESTPPLNPTATLGWVADMGFNLPRKDRRRYSTSRASCAA